MLSLGSFSASADGLYVVDKLTGQATPRGAAQNPKIGVDGGLTFVGPGVVPPVPVATPLGTLVLSSLLGPASWRMLRSLRSRQAATA